MNHIVDMCQSTKCWRRTHKAPRG